jgi:hypothetical protein
MHRGKAARQLFLEKEVVEMSIEQGPVHIEQDIVDLVPIQRVMSDG